MQYGRHDIYYDGMVHVCKRMCSTCVFRPGDLMHLNPGRLEMMIEEATSDPTGGGNIVCHSTLDKERQAVCKGFFDQHATPILQIAQRLGKIEYVTPPKLHEP